MITDDIIINPKTACCFTGHRPGKLEISEEELKKRLKMVVKAAINQGYDTFITGMAAGMDICAAEVVVEQKRYQPHIKLICMSPFEGFENVRDRDGRSRYRVAAVLADKIEYVCDRYNKRCFHLRNTRMVDSSNLVIAAYNGTPGGTKNTIMYAKRCGVRVINILCKKHPGTV